MVAGQWLYQACRTSKKGPAELQRIQPTRDSRDFRWKIHYHWRTGISNRTFIITQQHKVQYGYNKSPKASKQLFSLIATTQMDNKCETTWGTTISQNRIPFIVRKPHGNKLHYFDLQLAKSTHDVMNVVISTLSCDYTLWHRRMGHANQHMIKNLTDHTEGCPDNITGTPSKTCESCEKGNLQMISILTFKIKGNTSLRFSLFQSGWISSSLHWWFQMDHNLPWQSLILWSNVLFKEHINNLLVHSEINSMNHRESFIICLIE